MTGPKQMTDKQLAANRANALASTGPRTPEGKARSRWNALKHGALAQAVIPAGLEPFEARAAFDELFATLRAELAPATAMEELLVERIATSYWRLARVLRAEGAGIAQRQRDRIGKLLNTSPHSTSPAQRTLADSLENQVGILSDTLNKKRELRSRMVARDERWRAASDDELRAAAEQELADLQRLLADELAQVESQASDLLAMPTLKDAQALARYESTLERQVYRALDALERLQRQRAGETLPAPLRLDVDLDVSSTVPTHGETDE